MVNILLILMGGNREELSSRVFRKSINGLEIKDVGKGR